MWVKKSINSKRSNSSCCSGKEKKRKTKNKTRNQKWSNKNLSRTTKVHSHFESQSEGERTFNVSSTEWPSLFLFRHQIQIHFYLKAASRQLSLLAKDKFIQLLHYALRFLGSWGLGSSGRLLLGVFRSLLDCLDCLMSSVIRWKANKTSICIASCVLFILFICTLLILILFMLRRSHLFVSIIIYMFI